MGLDDLWRLQLALPLLALLMTLLVGGPATLLSYAAWRWSLSLLAKGSDMRASRVASALALVVMGMPAVFTLAIVVRLPGPFGVAGLLLVLALTLMALVHAAFRDESIREIGQDQELAEKLARLEVFERQGWLRDAGRADLPSFAGATKQRTLKRAVMVLVMWVAPLALLSLVRS